MINDENLESEIHLLELIQMTIKDGRYAWALLSIAPEKYESYKVDIEEKKPIDINSYGDVLAYKVGESYPSELEEDRLREEFGYQPNLSIEEKLRKILRSED